VDGGRGVSGKGPSLQDAFAQVGLGVLALVVEPASVEERETRAVRAHGVDSVDLLVNWLNECLYVLDVEGFVACRVEFITFVPHGAALGGEPLRLHCLLHGEEAEPDRHDSRPLLGTFSPEGASIIEDQDGVEARAVTYG
jgi:SHS2 domain-containing protein